MTRRGQDRFRSQQQLLGRHRDEGLGLRTGDNLTVDKSRGEPDEDLFFWPQRRRSWPPCNIAEAASGIFFEADDTVVERDGHGKNEKALGGTVVRQKAVDVPNEEGEEHGVPGDDSGLGQSNPNPNNNVMNNNNSVNVNDSKARALVRRRRIAGIFQHYYPEGGWGHVVLACATLVQICAHGTQLAMDATILTMHNVLVRRRFGPIELADTGKTLPRSGVQ